MQELVGDVRVDRLCAGERQRYALKLSRELVRGPFEPDVEAKRRAGGVDGMPPPRRNQHGLARR
eukprot:scaffold733_cov267-Pinguiococcus_pyrenoidosus.AAC.24